MNTNPYYVIKKPILTEESTIQTRNSNQYAFHVDPKANKSQIRDAVETMFNVKVLAVNTMNYQGKTRTRGRHRGRRPDWKKALVTLKDGDSIDLM